MNNEVDLEDLNTSILERQNENLTKIKYLLKEQVKETNDVAFWCQATFWLSLAHLFIGIICNLARK